MPFQDRQVVLEILDTAGTDQFSQCHLYTYRAEQQADLFTQLRCGKNLAFTLALAQV